MFPKPISWLSMEKLNLTQQNHTFSNQKKCTTTQNKHKKTKPRFSRLLGHPVWKQKGPILVSALHKCVTYLLRHFTHLLTAPGPTQGIETVRHLTNTDTVHWLSCQARWRTTTIFDRVTNIMTDMVYSDCVVTDDNMPCSLPRSCLVHTVNRCANVLCVCWQSNIQHSTENMQFPDFTLCQVMQKH